MSNDQIDVTNGDKSSISIGLTWVAYARMLPIFIGSILLLFIAAKLIGPDPLTSKMFYLAIILLIAWNAYEFALIQSKKLIINDIGVWYFSGIIPWKKQSHGLQWRNVGVVCYNNNFITYVTKSYTINISDRFTEKIAFSVSHVKNGAYIIDKINNILKSHAVN